MTEVIQGKLVVNNRRKKELLEELVKRKYAPMPRSSKKAAPKVAGNLDDEVDEAEAAAAGPAEGADYDYLLSLPLWSLTMEKVEDLKAEKARKEAELNALLAKSPRDLWSTDLDAFEAAWQVRLVLS